MRDRIEDLQRDLQYERDGIQAYLRESLEQIAEAAGVPVAAKGQPLPDGSVVDEIVKRIELLVAGRSPLPVHHDDALLTLRLAADVLSVSYSTITKWTARGEFCPQAFKLPNGEYRVRYRDLIRWALSMRGSEK